MARKIHIVIDGEEIEARAGQSILAAALEAGIYIPHLCYHPSIPPHGSCRVCTVKLGPRFAAACTTPAEDGMTVTNTDPELQDYRKALVEMLFVEGNHFCPTCERSGTCELQALAYRLGILAPRYPYLFPKREVDATHPRIFLDRNRCIQCGRCVQASRELDGKHVFELIGRGLDTTLAVSSRDGLGSTELDPADFAAAICPVGAINIRGTAFRTPIGLRRYDREPIGSDIEKKRKKRES